MTDSKTNVKGYVCHVCNKQFPWKKNGISTRNPETGECNSCYERNECIAKYKELVYLKNKDDSDSGFAAMHNFIVCINENPGVSPQEIYDSIVSPTEDQAG